MAEGTRKIRKFAFGNVSLLGGIIMVLGDAWRGSGHGSRIRNRQNSATGGQEDALGGVIGHGILAGTYLAEYRDLLNCCLLM